MSKVPMRIEIDDPARPDVYALLDEHLRSMYVTEWASHLAHSVTVQSISRKDNCWDNAVSESFFKTLKIERINQRHSSIG